MKRILLTRGYVTVVDDEDWASLSAYRWHAVGSGDRVYATRAGRKGERKSVLMHRVIMAAPGGMDVDHLNLDTLDNRRANLRVCTRSENVGNGRQRRNNKTGYHGVSWRPDRRKFAAQIKINRETTHLGYFDSALDAHEAYLAAAALAFF